jgi:hypothetical protein
MEQSSPLPSQGDQPSGDRRFTDRRTGIERRMAALPVNIERRRQDRRLAERRFAGLSPGEQLSTALDLLGHVAEGGSLDDTSLRVLDGAVLRVRAALDRLTNPPPPANSW